MTATVTASELAAMGLPGWPSTDRSWRRLREREGWATAPQRGPCGVELILVDQLPEDLRASIVAKRAAALRPAAPAAANDVRRSRGRPKGSSHFDRHPDQAEAVLSYVAAHKHSATNVLRLLSSTGFTDLPELRTVQRYIYQLEEQNPATLLRQRDPDGAKSRHQLALGRADGSVSYAHEVWELDTTKADVMTQGGRCMILGVIDRYSRRVRFMVAPSESGLSVRRLLIDTMIAWGVMPATVVTDNGSGYINASVISGLEALGIEHKPCLPGAPERKPFVERLFGTFMHTRAVLLDGFTGHNVGDAAKIRAKAKKVTGRAEILASMTTEELQVLLDQWVDGTYHQTVHSGIRTTPLARWMASPIPATACPARDHLEMALSAYVGALSVGKRGLRWKGGRYWCAELAAWIGRTVVARRDEEELGVLLAFDPDGHFIGRAVDHFRSGISEREFAIQARNHQRQQQRIEDDRIRAAKRAFPIERARDQMLRDEAERAGKLATLPLPTVARSTAQLDSFQPAPAVIPDEASIERATRRIPTKAKTVSPEEKVARADAIMAAANAGQTVDAAELRAARAYQGSTEYRATKMWSGQIPSAGQPSFPVNKEISA